MVAIIGTKKSGKTTVIERLLPVLRGRGLSVGTLKLIHHEAFTIHADGRDTARHWEAGAEFSMALAPGETTMVRRTRGGHESLADVAHLVPDGTDMLLCEGLVASGEDVRAVVCGRSADEVRTLVRELGPETNIVAASGVAAARTREIDGMEALDVMDQTSLERLADLVAG